MESTVTRQEESPSSSSASFPRARKHASRISCNISRHDDVSRRRDQSGPPKSPRTYTRRHLCMLSCLKTPKLAAASIEPARMQLILQSCASRELLLVDDTLIINILCITSIIYSSVIYILPRTGAS